MTDARPTREDVVFTPSPSPFRPSPLLDAALAARSTTAADNTADPAKTIRPEVSRHQAHDAARKLRPLDDDDLRDLFEVPELDLALTITVPITVPQLLTPDLQHLFDAIKAAESQSARWTRSTEQ